MKAIRLVLGILLGLCSLSLTKAQPYAASAQHYGTEQGLAHREVNAIFQDRQGFMWFGTKFGLNRFDGLHFTPYTQEANGLDFDDIRSIAQDADGILWLMGPYGKSDITLFNPVTGAATSFENRFKKPRSSTFRNISQSLLGSPDSTIFFANYEPATLSAYHPRSGLQEVALPQYKSLILAAVTARKTVWVIVNQTQLVELTPQGRVLQAFDHQAEIAVCLGQRNAGIEFFYFSLGTPARPKGGLYCIDVAGMRQELPISLIPSMEKGFHPVRYPFDRSGLVWNGSQLRDATNQILLDITDQLTNGWSAFFGDKNGGIWIGTTFGVYQIKVTQNYFRRLSYRSGNNDDRPPAVRGIMALGDTLYANLETVGLFASDRSGGGATRLLKNKAGMFYGLGHDGTGKLYVANGEQLVAYDRRTQQAHTSPIPNGGTIWTIHPFSSRPLRLLAGGLPGLWLVDPATGQLRPYTRHNGFPELAQAHVLHIAPDRQGTLWLCANTGLYTIDPLRGVTARYWSGGRGHFRLPADTYQHFYQDARGLFWLATANAGLIRWDRRQNQYRQFRRTEGLSNNTIYAVYADRRGHLWLSSDYGIMQFDPVRMTTRSYTVQDGITHNEFNRIAHFQAPDGQLYFGGLNGITSFDPRNFEREKPPVTLPLRIVSFRQFDQALDKLVDKTEELVRSNQIVLQPGDRTSVLDFALLNYSDAQNNVYAYQFKGLDSEWTYQAEPSLRLGNLPYGEFELLVKAQAADGRLSSANLAIQVIVLRPFYLRSWFLVLLGFLLIGSVWGWGRWRIWNHRNEQTRLQTQIRQATTQIEQDKKTIEQQAQVLQRLDETKSRFFANISHEFRTPLTVILGMAANLKLRPDPALRQTAGLIERQGSNLLRLINQILDLSRLEAGEMPFHLVRADLIHFIHYVGESFHSMAKARSIHLQFNASETSLEADFNPDKLQDILANLLSNALKFTPAGGQVTYEVAVQDHWQPLIVAGYHEELSPTNHLDKSWIRITVRDTGPGIEPASLAKIFDRFYQRSDDSVETASAGGTGIGLSLVRELVGLMQGGLAVQNRPEKGAEFVVSLPLTRQAPVAADLLPALLPVNPGQPEWVEPAPDTVNDQPVLLLVEDNDDVATYIQTCLRGSYQVVRAENGQEGIDRALAGIPDLILSDVMMPIKDGFALCDALKNDERTSHIPIVLLTARAAVSDRIAGLRRGADAYLVKPFQREELLVVLENLLQTRYRLQRYYGQLALGVGEPNPIPEEALDAVEDQFVVKLRSTLALHLDNAALDNEMICRLMGMSRNALHRKMTALTGLSINPYLRTLRLQKAKELLLRPELSIADVAYAVGFEDPKYFGRVFSEENGVSPGQFRASRNV